MLAAGRADGRGGGYRTHLRISTSADNQQKKYLAMTQIVVDGFSRSNFRVIGMTCKSAHDNTRRIV